MLAYSRTRHYQALLLMTIGLLLLSFYCSPARASSGTMNGNVASGSTAYYRVGGWTNYAYFQISFLSSFDLRLRLYDGEGNLIATGSTTSSTARQIYEYLSGGDTYYLAITYLSGTGAASFTLTYQDVNTISYYGTAAPFFTVEDQLRALTIGAPIIIGVGFAIIGIFGRMKIRQKKGEIPFSAPAQLVTRAPTTLPLQPAMQNPVPISSPPAPVMNPPEIKYCPYCGIDVAQGSTICKGCGNVLK